jgi:hypothetical protein
MNSAKIKSFYSENGVLIKNKLESSLDNGDGDFTIEIISFIVDLADAGVPGARSLLSSLAKCTDGNIASEREYENLLTEAFAAWFLERKQGAKIQAIEARDFPLHSPHARNLEKSCDLHIELGGALCYCEVKDCCLDFENSRVTGRRGYAVTSDKKKRKWLENRIKDCLKKGASYLIARAPIWESSSRSGLDAFTQILCEHTMDSPLRARIQVAFKVPAWFQGIFLIKRIGHLFVNVEQKQPERLDK